MNDQSTIGGGGGIVNDELTEYWPDCLTTKVIFSRIVFEAREKGRCKT